MTNIDTALVDRATLLGEINLLRNLSKYESVVVGTRLLKQLLDVAEAALQSTREKKLEPSEAAVQKAAEAIVRENRNNHFGRMNIFQARILALAALSDGEREALPVQGGEWRDIASAPKDGTEILGCGDYYGKPVRFVAVWNGVGWYAGWGDAIQPTLWMPLPPPPAQQPALSSDTAVKGEE